MVLTLSSSSAREQPIFSTRAHVFQIDPTTKRNWIPASKHAVTVSFFYDANRNVYRIISVGGTKVRSRGNSIGRRSMVETVKSTKVQLKAFGRCDTWPEITLIYIFLTLYLPNPNLLFGS